MKRAGAGWTKQGCKFSVWAPLKEKMTLHLVAPNEQSINMTKDEEGYFSVHVENISPGTRYFFRPDDEKDFPDPTSHYQPEGVHGPSEVIDHAFQWTDSGWNPPPLAELIFYELHVGTFTEEGTFDAIVGRLDDLVKTGINAIELMPVNQFPGDRNWGYDGAYPYAVQNSYGGPHVLEKLVNACHEKGVAVFLDVVYNHLGPEGNYLQEFGPYFTSKYKTPWGEALNFDEEWSDGVKDFFAGNAIYWLENYHIDGLRCDAIHMAYDNSAVPIWEYIATHVEQLKQKSGKNLYLVAESDLNSPRVFHKQCGYGFNAQWLDDFHHALYTVIDKKGVERYEDYGKLNQLAKAYSEGFVLSGEWVKYRKRKFGASSADVPGNHFVVFNQNHDQVGNRVKAERLSVLVDDDRLKLAAAAIFLSPYIPMLFMGEEYAEKAPFYYFVSHSDKKLKSAVREGRRKEFANLGFDVDPPDPFDRKTFESCRLNWRDRNDGRHGEILKWHEKLIFLRRTHRAFRNFDKKNIEVDVVGEKLLAMLRKSGDGDEALCLFNFSDEEIKYKVRGDLPNELLASKEGIKYDNKSHEVIIPPLSVIVYGTPAR